LSTDFQNVEAVLTAKVPVLKLNFLGIDVDVCVNNDLVRFSDCA
jgi:poly(A) polymerase Pap1